MSNPANTQDSPPTTNPKTHDSLFKWLITSFTREFFAHYFPGVRIGAWTFIDKEFISKYEALKQSLEDDLFLVMEVEIDEEPQELVIQIEHKSERRDARQRMYEYQCYAWLLKFKPVWSIIIYTDEARWRLPIADTFWYGFSNGAGKQYCHFDIIKVKAEKSADLMQKHSLLCKLLALKADDTGVDRESLVREIYQTVSRMENELTNEQKLLVDQWVQAYRKLPDKIVEKIKKEVNMSFVATTIKEHYINIGEARGELRGEARGEVRGEARGVIKGKIENLEELHRFGIITSAQLAEMAAPLQRQLEELQTRNHQAASPLNAGYAEGATA